MKEHLHAVVSWGVNKTGNRWDAVPTTGLPVPTSSRVVRVFPWSYSWNVCTYGYTAWAWDWARWEEEIDWMAIHGVNLPLAFSGQEAVWRQLWTEIGMTQADLDQWFSGPAFLPWQRMANIMGWAGPLDNDWIDAHKDMQVLILGRMLAMGMSPILAGFPGHVPPAFARIYPNASLTSTAPWGGFNDTYTVVPFLEPDDPLFKPLATRFYQITREVYGPNVHFYNADQFNEMRPRSSNLTFLREANEAVWDPMVAVDPNATFVMQAWLFHDQDFWTPTAVQAYLSAVPTGSMLILDLSAEQSPLWAEYDSFYGHGWIWCALHNYGGKPGMYGNLSRVATAPPSVKLTMPNATIRGTGFTPEAILQNPVYYELVTQMTWEPKPVDPAAFVVDWARRRYGGDSPNAAAAWQLLEKTIYNTGFSWSKFSEIQEEPSATSSSRWDLNGTASVMGVRMLMQAAAAGELDATSGPFNHDAVDLGHQAIGFMFADYAEYVRAVFAQYTGPGKVDVTSDIAPVAARMLELLDDMDALLATDPSFLMGHWLQQAVTSPGATTPAEVGNRLFNAKNQVTLWGPTGQINDYAAKHWAGLVKSYYGQRWANWTGYIVNVMAKNEAYDASTAAAQLLDIGIAWDASPETFPDETSGQSAIDVLKQVSSKYFVANSTVQAQFTAMPNIDFGGNDLLQSGTKDIDQLMLLCNALPSCKGFNHPGGYIKDALGTSSPSPGSTFYKRTAPAM